MWGTFILDIYRANERKEVADALIGLCDPQDGYGFASGGIYCYWDPDSRRVLYVGRAGNLHARFMQHNGLMGSSAKGNKREQIAAHFAANETLGFSILVRSPLSQGVIATHLTGIEDDLARYEMKANSREVEGEISDAEGAAIRSEAIRQDRLPAWNKIGGSEPVWLPRMTERVDTGDLFTGTVDCLLQARLDLRPLWEDATATRYEEQLHAARIEAVKRTMLENEQLSDEHILRAIDWVAKQQLAYLNPSYEKDVARIREDRYLLKRAAAVIAEPEPLRANQREAWTRGKPIPEGPPPPPLRGEPMLD